MVAFRRVLRVALIVVLLVTVGVGVLTVVVVRSAAVNLGLTPGKAPQGTSVPVSPTPTTRYLALAGSATHLLYARTSRSTGPIPEDETTGDRVLLASDGRQTAVQPGWHASLLGDEPLLFEPEFSGGNQRLRAVRWRLPEQGTSGRVPLRGPASNPFLVAAAPGGWLVTVSTTGSAASLGTPVRLEEYTTTGRRVDLGVPFPDGAPFAVEATDTGVLAWSFPGDGGDSLPDGLIEYRPFSGGAWRTLNAGEPLGAELLCTPASTALVSCYFETMQQRLGVYALPDGSARALPDKYSCLLQVPTATGFIGFNQESLNSCGRHLTFTTPDGHITQSRRQLDKQGSLVLAFGGVILNDSSQRHLTVVTSLDGALRTVVGR